MRKIHRPDFRMRDKLPMRIAFYGLTARHGTQKVRPADLGNRLRTLFGTRPPKPRPVLACVRRRRKGRYPCERETAALAQDHRPSSVR